MIFMHNQECTQNIVLLDGCEWAAQCALYRILPKGVLGIGPVQSHEGDNVAITFNFFL